MQSAKIRGIMTAACIKIYEVADLSNFAWPNLNHHSVVVFSAIYTPVLQLDPTCSLLLHHSFSIAVSYCVYETICRV